MHSLGVHAVAHDIADTLRHANINANINIELPLEHHVLQTTVAILWTHDAVNAGLRMGHVFHAYFMTEHLRGRGVGNVAIFMLTFSNRFL